MTRASPRSSCACSGRRFGKIRQRAARPTLAPAPGAARRHGAATERAEARGPRAKIEAVHEVPPRANPSRPARSPTATPGPRPSASAAQRRHRRPPAPPGASRASPARHFARSPPRASAGAAALRRRIATATTRRAVFLRLVRRAAGRDPCGARGRRKGGGRAEAEPRTRATRATVQRAHRVRTTLWRGRGPTLRPQRAVGRQPQPGRIRTPRRG
jgi:hypothetical protein